MNLHDVMTDLASALRGIEGLNVFPFWVDRITAPAAVVAWPDPYTFDATFGRGSDSADFPVVVLVGKADAEWSAVELGAYCNGSGPRSVKAVVEAYEATAYDVATVQSVEFAVTTVGSAEYLAATFTVSIVGQGT